MVRDQESRQEGLAAKPQDSKDQPMTAVEMINELARRGYIVPDNTEHYQPRMPTAYMFLPTSTAGSAVPDLVGAEAG